ncbi:MAG: VOC family protein, partial [Hyphomicrobiaceae bacterium]
MMKLSIVSVPVSDQQAAKAFYRDVLGFSVHAENDMGNGMTWLNMMPPEGDAGITLVTWLDNMPAGSQQGLVLETSDIVGTHGTLRERGLDIGEIQEAFWGRFTTFSDPDGNGWVLTA